MHRNPNYSQLIADLPTANEDQEIIKQLLIDIDSNTILRGLSEVSKMRLLECLNIIGLTSGITILEITLEEALDKLLIHLACLIMKIENLRKE